MQLGVALRRPNYSRAKALANDLLNEFGISEPPVNPIAIANGRGVEVRFVRFKDAMKDRISGFYDARDNMISVNADELPGRQTFTIAHELGHALLHREWAESSDYKVLLRDQAANTDDPFEKEANFFAANLLVPRWMLNKYVDAVDENSLSRLFAVSGQVIRNRISSEYGGRY